MISLAQMGRITRNGTLRQTFHSKVVFEKWNGNQKPKKNLRKERWERTTDTTKWDKLGQVGVCGTSGTRGRGSSDLSGTSGTRRIGSSDLRGTSGTRSSWDKWDKDKVSVHLNHSNCPQGRGTFIPKLLLRCGLGQNLMKIFRTYNYN